MLIIVILNIKCGNYGRIECVDIRKFKLNKIKEEVVSNQNIVETK